MNVKTQPSAQSSAEKKTKTVNKKLITEPENLTKTSSASATTTGSNTNVKTTEQANTSPQDPNESVVDQRPVQNTENPKQQQQKSSVNTNLVKSKAHAATVSVANIMNSEAGTNNKLTKNQQKGTHL